MLLLPRLCLGGYRISGGSGGFWSWPDSSEEDEDSKQPPSSDVEDLGEVTVLEQRLKSFQRAEEGKPRTRVEISGFAFVAAAVASATAANAVTADVAAAVAAAAANAVVVAAAAASDIVAAIIVAVAVAADVVAATAAVVAAATAADGVVAAVLCSCFHNTTILSSSISPLLPPPRANKRDSPPMTPLPSPAPPPAPNCTTGTWSPCSRRDTRSRGVGSGCEWGRGGIKIANQHFLHEIFF